MKQKSKISDNSKDDFSSNKETTHKNIYEALHAAYKNTGYVQKTGNLKYGTTAYKYAGENDLIEAIRPELEAHGIIFYCSDICEKERVNLSTVNIYNKEVINHIYSAIYTFVFHHVHSGTEIYVKAMGKGIDTGDKAEYKAATGALKYALRQTFIVETGDDPDKTASDQQEIQYFDIIKNLKAKVSNVKTADQLTIIKKNLYDNENYPHTGDSKLKLRQLIFNKAEENKWKFDKERQRFVDEEINTGDTITVNGSLKNDGVYVVTETTETIV